MNRNPFRGPRLGAYGFFPKKIVPRGTSIWFFCRVVREKHATCSRLLSRARAARKIRQKSRSPAAVTRSGTGSHGSPAAGREARAGHKEVAHVVPIGESLPNRHDDGNRPGGHWGRPTGRETRPTGHGWRYVSMGSGTARRGPGVTGATVATRETFGSGRPFCNGHKKARHWAGLGGAGAG